MSLRSLKEKNQYPIVFIGSGMAKRYVESSLDWLSLLEEYWKMLDRDVEFYSYLSDLSDKIKLENPELSDDDLDFSVNTMAATEIQKLFNEAYNLNNSLVPNLSSKSRYIDKISPFKASLSNRFSEIHLKKEDMKNELSLFAKLLSKAKIIVTTNYDNMIEELLESENKSADVFIGNKGFFKDTTGWGELYKIHGTVDDPSSIIITEEDYKSYEENSILLNAKLLANLVDSPILFLGYSMTDKNVRSLLQVYSRNLPTDISQNADRITIIEHDEGNMAIIENVENDPSLGINYTRIRTDNYEKLFSQISGINQGVSPAYIRKYQQLLKEIRCLC